jgi:hypothetical protein
MSESCSTCRFFAKSAARGVCRRRPPVWTGPDDSHDEGMFAFPAVHPHSWCGEYEYGEVQSMLRAVREAESDGMLTTEEAEAFLAVRPEATVEPMALLKRVALSDAEREAIEVAAEAYAGDHGQRFAEILRLLLKRSK